MKIFDLLPYKRKIKFIYKNCCDKKTTKLKNKFFLSRVWARVEKKQGGALAWE